MIDVTEIESPIGPLALAAHDGRVCLLHFGRADDRVRRTLHRWYPSESIGRHADPAGAVTVLDSYFNGKLNALDAVAVEMNGTLFQQRVWDALRRVAAGKTASYIGIARAIGAPASVRAVGAANGANPVAVIVPCHRIIGANGSLTGYGGGLARKEWLLRHERATGWGQQPSFSNRSAGRLFEKLEADGDTRV
jgi:methylated-DNA-[protein]-cysteine S-methyltransferase